MSGTAAHSIDVFCYMADKYIDLVGMNTSNGAQAQIWNFVSGGNQEWNLERVDPTVQQTRGATSRSSSWCASAA